MVKKDIYEIGRNLGLDKNDINFIINSPHIVSIYTPTADVYKNGTDYGTVSLKDVYKVGALYGTISLKDF